MRRRLRRMRGVQFAAQAWDFSYLFWGRVRAARASRQPADSRLDLAELQ